MAYILTEGCSLYLSNPSCGNALGSALICLLSSIWTRLSPVCFLLPNLHYLTHLLLWQRSLWCLWCHCVCAWEWECVCRCICENLTTRWHKCVGLSQNSCLLRRESAVLTHTHSDMLRYSERVQDPLTDVTTQLIIKMWEWEWRLPLWSGLIRVVCLITHRIQNSSHLHADATRS